MSTHILVTGGAGYLGSTMVPMLLDAGYRVTVLDNFMYRQASLNQLCHRPEFEVARGDIRDERALLPLLKTADAVIPLAAHVGAPLCQADPIGAESVNRDAALMMLRHVSRDQLVLMPTTNSAYGTGDEGRACTEASPLRPMSKYAVDKVAVERVLMEHPNAVSFRLATVFGMSPRMRLDLLVNDFTYRAVTDRFLVLFEAHFKRNYIHVRDVARAFLHALAEFGRMRGNIYNVGLSEANLSKQELCQRLQRHLPDFYFTEAEVGHDADQRNYVVSNDKIEATGYQPQVTLDAGIREMIKGFAMLRNTVYGNV